MTEEEARKTACCGPEGCGWRTGLLRLSDSDMAPATPERVCLASDCMAWRWSDEKRAAAYLEAVAAHMKATGESFNKRREEFAYTEGYCGLAVKP